MHDSPTLEAVAPSHLVTPFHAVLVWACDTATNRSGFRWRRRSVTAGFFRNAGRSVEQLQDRLACFVELIGIVTRRPYHRDGTLLEISELHRPRAPVRRVCVRCVGLSQEFRKAKAKHRSHPRLAWPPRFAGRDHNRRASELLAAAAASETLRGLA